MQDTSDPAYLLLLAEQERRRRKKLKTEGAKYDWYGEPCECDQYDPVKNWCPEHPRARPDQRPPEGDDWLYWSVLAGRGFGKTRTGAEFVRDRIMFWHERGFDDLRIALVAPTAADVRDTMVKGESGLLAIAPPWFRPEYKPSYRTVVYPNGAQAIMYSADEPDRLRGPQHHYGWLDEISSWRTRGAYDMVKFGLRLGAKQGIKNRLCITTTPKPIPWVRSLWKMPQTVVSRGSSYDNRDNLTTSFIDEVIRPFEGTRLGRQEIYADDLEDVDGALWKSETLDKGREVYQARVRDRGIPERVRVVVSVDPSVADPDADPDHDIAECGITVGYVDEEGLAYVVEDLSLKAHPNDWATVAVEAYERHQADVLVAEINNGGAMVESVIRAACDGRGRYVNYKTLHASRGKTTRAEPVATLYEQGKVFHTKVFPELENQLCTWVQGLKSPDRLDSLVWLITELCLEGAPGVWAPHPFAGFRG